MNIVYLHQYFKTPRDSGSTRSYWISRKLIEKGHRVIMITSSSKNNKNIERKNIDGIEVIYLKNQYNQNLSILKRLFWFVHFMIFSSLVSLRLKSVQLVIATSTPLSIGVPALVLYYLKGINYIFEVRDLWPEVPIQMGAIKNEFIKTLATKFERLCYAKSKHIVALSPGMADGVRKFESAKKVTVIPNMSKIDVFWPREKNEKLIKQLKLKKDSFKIIHFGSLGISNDVISIIKGAEKLKDNDSFEFIFIGGGSLELDLKKYCEKKDLRNVIFLGAFNMSLTSEIVNLCDVSIVSFKDIPILYTNSPNKLFDSLSAGLPIIVNSAGWTKDLVEKFECGFYYRADDTKRLVEIILNIKNNKLIKNSMGKNSRLLAEKKFDKEILCEKFYKVINKALLLN